MGNLKTGSFMDGPKEMTVLSIKQGIFVDGSREMTVLTKKETPRKDVSIFGVEQGGRLKNRGRPWPREREGPNAVGRDLVFQPSLPAITY